MNTFATTASRDQDGAASKRYIRCTDPKRVMNYLNKRQIRARSDVRAFPGQVDCKKGASQALARFLCFRVRNLETIDTELRLLAVRLSIHLRH